MNSCRLPTTGGISTGVLLAAVLVLAAGIALVAVTRRRAPVTAALLVLLAAVFAASAPAEASPGCPPETSPAAPTVEGDEVTPTTDPARSTTTTTVGAAAPTTVAPGIATTSTTVADGPADPAGPTETTAPTETIAPTETTAPTGPTETTAPAPTEPTVPPLAPVAVDDERTFVGVTTAVFSLDLLANDLHPRPLLALTLIEYEEANGPECGRVEMDTSTGIMSVAIVEPAVCDYEYYIETPGGVSNRATVRLLLGLIVGGG